MNHYLASFERCKWKAGELDCGVFIAGWVKELTGFDPISDVRNGYSTERQFLRILRREGGFVRSFSLRLIRSGFVETLSPRQGDVAAVLAPCRSRSGNRLLPTGAICLDHTWRAVMTADSGLVLARSSALPSIKVYTNA